jgi:hypothetical protein
MTAGQVKAADLASDAVTPFDDAGLQTDIAILGFKVAANGSLAKYDLVDQTIDDFQNASGVDASASTNEARDGTGKYYCGSAEGLGGTKTTYSSGGTDYVVHRFTSNDNFIAAASGTADILIVAGGAAGGKNEGGGGGGAGGFKYFSQRTLSAGTYAAVVGTGGDGLSASGNNGKEGGDTTFDSQTALGGGGGGTGDGANIVGVTGGSGGGGGGRNSTSGAAGTTNQGNAGGSSSDSSNALQDQGGGGGGASAAGASGSSTAGGNGGAGYTEGATVYHWQSGSGTVTFPTAFYNGSTNSSYAGGGGGGCTPSTTGGAGNPGSGGIGGGGTAENGTGVGNGTDGTGGGGSGSSNSVSATRNGGDGGDGVAIIRYVSGQFAIFNNMTLISNATTAEAVPTKGDLVMTYSNGAGTASIGDGTNGDIRAFVSRDNGTTYTQFTLTDDGDTGGHTILTAHDLDISGQPSGSAMRYKITTHNQSVSKQTRIQAVSLGWS